MHPPFAQLTWDSALADECRALVRLAILEDLNRSRDWTTEALAQDAPMATAGLVSRDAGVVCGLPCVPIVIEEMDAQLTWTSCVTDGDTVCGGDEIGRFTGSPQSLLTCERILLNFVGKLSGIATRTAQFVARVADTQAVICDTRKTTPGWRRLEKYAVRMGGGTNHRLGLYDAVLIKDNHIALVTQQVDEPAPAFAVRQVRAFLAERFGKPNNSVGSAMVIEVEVDSLDQLVDVLPSQPDIVLLDNMTVDELRRAVAIRDQNSEGSHVLLEASGRISLDTVASVASTGVERISIGALTHTTTPLDIGLDWR